jgi:hypothetical protein
MWPLTYRSLQPRRFFCQRVTRILVRNNSLRLLFLYETNKKMWN